MSPEQIYPVFAPKPGAAQSNAPWRWEDGERDSDREDEGEEASSSGASDVPKWNPRTGFMKTQADIEAEQAAAVEAAAAAAAAAAVTSGAAGAGGLAAATPAPASAAGRPGTSGLRTGSGAAAAVRATSGPVEVSLTAPGPVQQPSAASTSAPAAAPLPPASRNAVLTSALGTGFWMAVIAVFFRNYAGALARQGCQWAPGNCWAGAGFHTCGGVVLWCGWVRTSGAGVGKRGSVRATWWCGKGWSDVG